MSRAAMTLWSISHTTLDAALGFRVASFIFIFCRVFLLKQTWRNFSWGAWVLAETHNNLNVEAGLNIRLGRRHWGFFWRQVVLPSSHIKHWSTDTTASPLAGTTPSSSGSTSLEACSVSITISSWSSSHPHASLFLGHRWLNHCMFSCLRNLKLQFECQNVFKCDNRTACYVSLVC